MDFFRTFALISYRNKKILARVDVRNKPVAAPGVENEEKKRSERLKQA